MYEIVFTAPAAKSLQKIHRNTAMLIREKLEQLATDPYASHPNVAKLQGRSGFRLRVSDRRVIYEIQKDNVVIIVMKITPRGEVHR